MQITRRLTLFGAAATPAVAMPIAQTTPGPDAELLALRRTFLAEHAIVTARNAGAVDEDIGEPAHDRWWECVEAMTDIAATSPRGLRAKAEVALLAFETTGGEGGPDEDLIRSVLRDAARA
jgi:hypothetical protein